MSGEGGAALIGGALLIGALPVVIAGAAVIGAAVGLAHLGAHAASAAQRRRRETALKVERCSAELSGVFSRLDAALQREQDLTLNYYRGVEQRMTSLAETIRTETGKAADVAAVAGKAEEARREGVRALNETRETEMRRIRTETETVCREVAGELSRVNADRMAMEAWSQETEAARAEQRAVAEDLLRDARAVVDSLLELGKTDPAGAALRKEAEALEEARGRAESALERGLCQSAAAGAQQVITRGVTLASRYVTAAADRYQLAVAAEAGLAGLKEELAALRVFSFEDECFGASTEDMDEFTQGAYGKLQAEIDGLLETLASPEGDRLTDGELMVLLSRVRDELTPRAKKLIAVGHEQIMKYYERLHALELIIDNAEKDGYKMEWVRNVGQDPTQKMVLKLTNKNTMNSISVSLDDDPRAAEGGMDMQVRFYYGEDRPVTEAEKKAVRDRMMAALREKGLMGTMVCTGSVNKPAEDKSLASPEGVQALPVKSVV